MAEQDHYDSLGRLELKMVLNDAGTMTTCQALGD